ncbi:MAG TPA: hypothetical protein VNA22_07015 [Pyrinomonadaceae bacterium]|nr:hypothetical protein [Pyrinomonadaceae bacterium]
MKKAAFIVLIGSLIITLLSLAIWVAGFFLAVETFGGLIHLFLLLAFAGGFGVFIGAILLIITLVQKK